MNLYFISGIGADRRIFKYILLPPGFSAQNIDQKQSPPKNISKNYEFIPSY
jgi:hypothetical protein